VWVREQMLQLKCMIEMGGNGCNYGLTNWV
jgi:hypothetical protein